MVSQINSVSMKHRLALITGSTGFIGSRLAAVLATRGWQVRITLRPTSKTARLAQFDSERVELDLTRTNEEMSRRALDGVSHIFHVAGLVSGTPAQLDQVNREGTGILIRAAAGMPNPPHFLLVSSAAALGPSRGSLALTPDQPPAPISNYGRSKLAGERIAITERGECPLTIVRPGIVFGEGDTEFIRILRAITRLRVNAMIGPGTQPLSMIEIDDLVDLMIRAAEMGERVSGGNAQGDAAGGVGIYHAADPLAMSLLDLGQVVRECCPQHRFLNLHFPLAAGYCLGAATEFCGRLLGKSPTLNRDKIREARAPGWALDVQKSVVGLGWQPRQSLANHLADVLRDGLRLQVA